VASVKEAVAEGVTGCVALSLQVDPMAANIVMLLEDHILSEALLLAARKWTEEL
jgi:hypothetical protein